MNMLLLTLYITICILYISISQADYQEKGDTPDKTTKISGIVKKVLKFDFLLRTSISGVFSLKKMRFLIYEKKTFKWYVDIVYYDHMTAKSHCI